MNMVILKGHKIDKMVILNDFQRYNCNEKGREGWGQKIVMTQFMNGTLELDTTKESNETPLAF